MRAASEFDWLENDTPRTTQINPATAVHPVTGEKMWFNQAHLFHVSNLHKEFADTLIGSLGEKNLPRNTYYGDGSPIELGCSGYHSRCLRADEDQVHLATQRSAAA